MKETRKIIKKISEAFNGTDPIAEAVSQMKIMSHDDLEKLVLIAANKIGLLLKGSDYDDPSDAAMHFCLGINGIFENYNIALDASLSNTDSRGNA